jgi:uncharacterized delta-60 repeat protein
MHPLAMALDSIGLLAWAFLVYFLKQLISKTQATTRIWIRIAVLFGVPVVLFWYWITPNTFALSHSASADNFKPRLRLLAPGVLSVAFGSAASAAGLALQKDGTIVIGGYSGWWPKVLTPSTPNPSRAVVLRLAPNDRLGRPAVTLLADTPSVVTGVATGHDGTIAVVGRGGHSHSLVARLLPDGVPDPAFGGSGVVLAKMRSSMVPASSGGSAVAIQSDGRIVTTGSAGYVLGPLAGGSYCTTARFTRDGRFDRRFGDKGRVLALVPGNTLCGSTSVLAAPDGKIIVVGTYNSEQTEHHIAVFRYLPDGTLDRQFGRNGIAELLKVPKLNQVGAQPWIRSAESWSSAANCYPAARRQAASRGCCSRASIPMGVLISPLVQTAPSRCTKLSFLGSCQPSLCSRTGRSWRWVGWVMVTGRFGGTGSALPGSASI